MDKSTTNIAAPSVVSPQEAASLYDHRDFNVWAAAVKHQMLSALKRRQHAESDSK